MYDWGGWRSVQELSLTGRAVVNLRLTDFETDRDDHQSTNSRPTEHQIKQRNSAIVLIILMDIWVIFIKPAGATKQMGLR